MNSTAPTYTLITGSSHGIGRAMAIECAKRGQNLLLVALDEPLLQETLKEIQSDYPIMVDCIGIDLTHDDTPAKILEWCKARNYAVDTLINNAGIGRGGLFENKSLKEYNYMIRLNVQAMIGLTYSFIPELKKHPLARILNVSSMEATLPLPYKAVYTGTKSFIYSFSLALREELKTFSPNIKLSILCPGPVPTHADGLERLRSQGWRGKLMAKLPEKVARTAIEGMLGEKVVIIPGTGPYLIVKLMNFFTTSTKMSILERIFRRYSEL